MSKQEVNTCLTRPNSYAWLLVGHIDISCLEQYHSCPPKTLIGFYSEVSFLNSSTKSENRGEEGYKIPGTFNRRTKRTSHRLEIGTHKTNTVL